jgi:hypothetical protein
MHDRSRRKGCTVLCSCTRLSVKLRIRSMAVKRSEMYHYGYGKNTGEFNCFSISVQEIEILSHDMIGSVVCILTIYVLCMHQKRFLGYAITPSHSSITSSKSHDFTIRLSKHAEPEPSVWWKELGFGLNDVETDFLWVDRVRVSDTYNQGQDKNDHLSTEYSSDSCIAYVHSHRHTYRSIQQPPFSTMDKAYLKD